MNDHPTGKQNDSDDETPPIRDVVKPTENSGHPENFSDSQKRIEKKPMTRYEILNLVVTSIGVVVAMGVWIIYAFQLSAMREATEAAQKSAEAAQAAVKASQEAARLDQRAWLTVQHLKLLKEPQATEGISVLASVVNTGRTPATFTYKYVIRAERDESPWPGWEVVPQLEGAQVIFPGDIPRTIRASGPAFGRGFQPDAFQTGDYQSAQIQAYRKGQAKIYVRFRMEYRDIFECEHFTQVCASHSFGDAPDIFRACEKGNAIDDGKQCTQ